MADLRTLDARLYPWAKWLRDVGIYYDSRIVVTSAYRSMASQQRLYDRWRMGMSTLPAAPPGRSLHQYRLAFDLARAGVDPREDDLLMRLGAIWTQVGGTWGGSADPVHFAVNV